MLRIAKHLLAAVFVLLFAACSGESCSCGGVAPLPAGFPAENRIENAASVRLTDSGIAFLEDNVGALASTFLGEGGGSGVMTFPIDTIYGSFEVWIFELVVYWVCPNGPNDAVDPPECIVEINLAEADLYLESAPPHNLRTMDPGVHKTTIPVRIQRLPIDLAWLWGLIESHTTLVGNGNDACPPDDQDYAHIGVTANLSIEIDTNPQHVRNGYSQIKVEDLSIDSGDIADAVRFCGTGVDDAILGALKDILVPFLLDSLVGELGAMLEEQLCQPANPELDPPCPLGTTAVDGICRYGSDADAPCASIILGMEGNIDLSELLASISPGTQGGFDMLFAVGGHSARPDGSGFAWGDLNPIAGGVTLGMYGGAEPTPTTSCAPLSEIALPTGVPIPAELMANAVAGWPEQMDGPHVGIALSERFLNYALAQIYNSGALCLGVGGDLLPPELNSGVIALGLGAKSMVELGRQKAPQPLAIILRPQQPPQVTFGNGTDIVDDPLLRLTLPAIEIDFYIWSLDRWIRAMTVAADIDVPANLEVTPDGLQPVLEEIGLLNVTVSNTPLVREDPAIIAAALQGLVSSMVGDLLGGALPAFNLNESLADFGLQLLIPPTEPGQGSPGLRKLEQGGDRFLGIFAGLALASGAKVVEADTEAELMELDLGPATEQPMGWGTPVEATLRLSGSLDRGTGPVEWQVRVDDQPWHPFTSESIVRLRDPVLRLPGRHRVSVRARAVGDALSLDPSPATVELVVDREPPELELFQQPDGQLQVEAADAISAPSGLRLRLRLGELGPDGPSWGPWTDWEAASGFEPLDGAGADLAQVEAEDEAGHSRSTTLELIRGRGSGDGGSCQCQLPRRQRGLGPGLWLAAAALGALALRRSRGGRPRRLRRLRSVRGALLLGALAVASSSSGCSCSDETAAVEPGCRGRGDCVPLEPGLIGAYTSAAVAPDGTLWVAGYLEANWEDDYSWGDLVVGPHDGNGVVWQVVDGLPADATTDIERYDPQGFRRGITESGDDVGLWTSVAIAADGAPAVAYYDVTGGTLRYASLEGSTWQTTSVDQRDHGDVGRYAELMFVEGRPVIAYAFIEPGQNNAVQSGVRLATGSSPSAAEAQWSFEDVSVDPATPCRAAYCPTGTKCVLSNGLCAKQAKDCTDSCGDGESCVEIGGQSQCAEVAGSSSVKTYPEARGLYVSMAATPAGGFGLAFYDRIHGNVMVASRSGGEWLSTIVDGEDAEGNDTGDAGIGTSLFIDGQGDYHLAYVDGIQEALMYQWVEQGSVPGTPEIVDDGFGVDGVAFADGLHIVGDDSDILVSQGGEVHISYQDATAGTLRLAVGAPAGGGHEWTRQAVAQEGFAGFFSQQVHQDGARRIVNWWRAASPNTHGEVRVVSGP